MGESKVIKKRTGLGTATALLAVSLLAGCSASNDAPRTRATQDGSPPPVSATQVRRPAEIQMLELTAEGAGVALELSADRPLVWTSFRDSSGDLVIELPNSMPSASVGDLRPPQGLVASVDVELLDDADRPLTRLVVRTREASEHSLAGEDDSLKLQLLPVANGQAVALAYEPLPSEDLSDSGANQGDADDGRAQDAGTAVAEGPAAEAPAAVPPPTYRASQVAAQGTADAPLAGPPPTGVPASQLYGIEVLHADDGTVIQVAGDGEFDYTSFRLQSPERFVIDLAGVTNMASRSSLPVGSRQVEQIRIGQFKARPDPVSRVVFDLGSATVPVIERTGEGLVVRFGDGAGAQAAAAMAGQSAGGVAPTTTLAEDVATDTSDSYASSDTYEPAAVEEVAVEEVAVEETTYVEEPMVAANDGASDYGTDTAAAETAQTDSWQSADAADTMADNSMSEPVPTYEAPAPAAAESNIPVYEPTPAAQPTGEAMAVADPPSVSRPVGTSDVSLFEAQEVQIDDTETEENPVLQSFGALVVNRQERQYVGDRIDMSLKKADLVETLRSFATISDLNFVIQPGVSGSVTVELKGVPWDQAMEQILKINNLGMDIDGTIVRIAPMSQLRNEAEEQRRLAVARQNSVPLKTVLKSLSYSNAQEVADLLRNRTGSLLSSRGTVQVDERTNTLIIRELPDAVDTVLAVIENLDAPEPQVTIEARIIEATKSFSRTLGIQWGYSYDANQALGNATGLAFPSSVDLDGSVGLLTGGSTGLLSLSLGNLIDSFTLDAQLQVAENEGLVNLVSAPRVTTLNNNSASIQSGVQIPVQTVSNNTVSVQFVNATLQLTVIPQVTAEGTIVLDINVAKRSPAPGLAIAGATNSPISTREARTKVIVRDGGTAVIGGIYEVSSNEVQDRLPGLANIPILGHLFKNRNRSNSNDELMIFITPRIVQM